ncbi:MAG: hypothetical protein V4568_18970 [Pseudomonadota bacterium]
MKNGSPESKHLVSKVDSGDCKTPMISNVTHDVHRSSIRHRLACLIVYGAGGGFDNNR